MLLKLDKSKWKCEVTGKTCAVGGTGKRLPIQFVKEREGTTRLFAKFDWRHVTRHEPKNNFYCQCCEMELWIKGINLVVIKGLKQGDLVLPNERLIGSGKPISDKEFRQDSERVKNWAPFVKTRPCVWKPLSKKTVWANDQPGFELDMGALEKLLAPAGGLSAKVFISVFKDFSFEVRIFNVCSKPEKLVKTEKYKLRMGGRITTAKGEWYKAITWETDAPACKGGSDLQDTFGNIFDDVPPAQRGKPFPDVSPPK